MRFARCRDRRKLHFAPDSAGKAKRHAQMPRKQRSRRRTCPIQAPEVMLVPSVAETRTMLVLKHVYHAHGSDGEDYEVHVYAESADAEGGGAPIEKLKLVSLADGRKLRVVGKGHYELPDGSLKLESHDPEAI
jgi:hypothetical protein